MLQSRLTSILQRELQSQSLELSSYGKQQLELLVGNGVQRMRINQAEEHAGHIMQAEQNLRALIKYLSNYARTAGTFPSLTDSSFDVALNTCPTLWPFCSSG